MEEGCGRHECIGGIYFENLHAMKPTLTPARFLFGVTALSVALSAAPAQATIYTLAPGASITANSSGAPVGGAIVGQVTDPYSSGIMSGTLTSTVISGDATVISGDATVISGRRRPFLANGRRGR